jgi:hypothetical protein
MNALSKASNSCTHRSGGVSRFRIEPEATGCPNTSELFTGEVQQFSARLSGRADSSHVTWTATGGTVSTLGLFTAGATAGRFLVVAATPKAADTAVVLVSSRHRKTYETNFSVIEAPLSERGQWAHTDSLLTTCRTLDGRAFGTQSGSNGYDDSNAYLLDFGTDYEIEGVVWLNPQLRGPGNRDVEILLRWTDDGPVRSTAYGPTHANGYEINVQHAGAYMQVGRFKGALLKRVDNYAVPRTGDRFRARIEGQRIRVWWNDVLKIDFTDAAPGLQVLNGNPGIGFYVSDGASNTDFGFESVRVTALATGR